MKLFLRVSALLLAVLTLMTACTKPPVSTPEDTTPSTESATTEPVTEGAEAPKREVYEDLSRLRRLHW